MDAYNGWAILELMGHKRLAGYVREEELFGQPVIAVDMTVEGRQITQFYSPDALYCLTPTTEEVVKAVQPRLNDPAPIHEWEIAALKQIPAPDEEDEPEFDDDDIPC